MLINTPQSSSYSIKERPWVVIPTYNEIENIQKMIESLFDLDISNLNILIVDDNSPDGTADKVRSLKRTYPNLHLLFRPKKDGLGQAYVAGFDRAINNKASSIVQMDADFSHDPKDVPKLLSKLSQQDLVLGSRYRYGISVINWPLKRLIISMAGNLYASLITGLPFKDSTGGFKAWRTTTLESINFRTVTADGYGFQIVTTFRSWKKGVRIIEVPIVFTERHEGKSKMSRAIVIEAIFLVWKLRLFGK